MDSLSGKDEEGVHMNYFMGIDGGGTNTIALVGDEGNNPLALYKGGATNYQSIGVEKVKENFQLLFEYFKVKNNININDFNSICLGCAGVNSSYDIAIYEDIICSLGYKGQLLVYNDAVAALVGANGKMEGAVLISGTGSIVYGINKEGKHIRIGGWGHIIGDEGSGYAIGRDALQKVSLSFDGRNPPTKLWKSISEKLNISSSEQLMRYIYNLDTKKQQIANIAPIVISIADEDEAALDVLNKAITDLKKMIYALDNKLCMESYDLALSGSILLKNFRIRNALVEEIKSINPKINVHMPYNEPHFGALILAKENWMVLKNGKI